MAAVNANPPQLTEQDIARFWGRVDKSPGQGPQGSCWQARVDTRNKYGQFQLRGRGVRPSRLSYFLATGSWPIMLVLHRCDNPPCVNPEHLFLGTNKDNTRDMLAKGRAQVGDRHYSRTHPEKLARGDRHGRRRHPEAQRGERNPSAKLTEIDVREIRALYATGKWSKRGLARRYGMSHHPIMNLLSGRTWSHVH